MANDTPKYFQNLVIYEIYIRNHGPNGTFSDVEADLPRIKSLGVDVVWFMPIHPIGKAKKKGDKGSPYSIKDYRDVNPEYGDIEDFKRLIKKSTFDRFESDDRRCVSSHLPRLILNS